MKITHIIFTLTYSILVFSQKNDKVEYLSNFDEVPLRYGFYMGVNYNDYNISYKASALYPDAFIETNPELGFNIGLIGDLRLHKNFNLRIEPGLMTNTKSLYFKHIDNKVDSVRKVSGTFMHVPILLQISADRMHNMRPYIAGGVAYDYNFASNSDNPNDNSGGEFRMTKHNLMYEVGIGMDFYLYYFKFSPSIRGVFALNKELKDDEDPNSQWTQPVDYFGTRGIFFKMTFQ